MAENLHKFKINRLCNLMGVSRSGFYAWLDRPASNKALYDEELKRAIKELHQGYKRCYGARRIYHSLKKIGYSCSIRRVSRLMKELGIKASTRGLYTWSPGLNEFYAATPNRRPGLHPASSFGEQWAGDFTYIKTKTGSLYHAVIIDLFSRRVVGASFSVRRGLALTSSALRNALARHKPEKGCLFHSDQGSEYAAFEYREMLESNGFNRSMSRKGTPLDNAEVESYFHTMKAELAHQVEFENIIDAVAQISEYIAFYNKERIHSSLGYHSPQEYEKLYA
ncbi:IS3 family transposase [Agaribacterium sp. ZY112]|uniref:IS3 family transposase n=1 Tax=Agaribacterium sp. ZY112 TaxID=3233574 RepID=UPI003525AA70